ncbi:MAG: hypothetical protein KKB20_11480 [Proteobacteria bacterium]|nr:hypothetical protein [Pseudomonadota bacterium]
MPQKLNVKVRGPNGESITREVVVIRIWQESSGRQIFLHANGVYGYKDGSPVQRVDELSIISDSIQRKAALAWWERKGRNLSAEHYARVREEIEALQRLGLPEPEDGDVSALDTVLYRRRLVKDRRKAAFSEPSTWFEWFDHRPDWWGFASVIEIGEMRYELVGDEEVEAGEEEEPEPESGPAETS